MANILRTNGPQKVKVFCYPAGHDEEFPSTEKEEQQNRYKVFRGLRWNANYDDKKRIETDQYDVAPTVKFVCVSPYLEKFLGSVRLMPMKYLSMIRDAFSDAANPSRNLVNPGFQLPQDPTAAEISRLVIRKEFLKPKPQSHRPDKFKEARDEVIARLFVAMMAYCRYPEVRPPIPGLNPEDEVVIKRIFGISYVDAWEPVFAKRGLTPNFIGPAKWVPTVEKQDPPPDEEVLVEHIQAGWVEANWDVAEELCTDYGLTAPYFYTKRDEIDHAQPYVAI
jgi:N-acyl-L-homoserine lactone synthetase